MSIEDNDGTEIVKLGTLHAFAFKILIWIGMLATPAAFVMFWNHGEAIRLHEWRITSLERQTGRSSAGNTNTNIITSDAAKTADSKSGRTFLTTAEVAKREQVSERTVTDWIASGRIQPAPVKDGKEWQISAQYRIPPQISALSGTEGVRSN